MSDSGAPRIALTRDDDRRERVRDQPRVGSVPAEGSDHVVHCENLVKIYKSSGLEAVALQGLDFTVGRGEIVAIVGASGSGKSTLLGVLGGRIVPSAGTVVVDAHDLLTMSTRDRTRYRRRTIGFVHQQTGRNLLPYASAVENVELPMSLIGVARRSRRRRAIDLLDQVGVADRASHRPSELSGGEQQRVAIAVALANRPAVVLADEPTGELDSSTAAEVVEVLHRVNAEAGVTVVVVTHDRTLADGVGRTVSIRDGRASGEVLRRTSIAADGSSSTVAEEFAVLDRVGRLQLPTDYVDALGLKDRVRLRLRGDHITIREQAADVDAPARSDHDG